MKIGMMSAWNEDSGASVHAELVGREWIRMGHDLHVFSFLPTNFHGTAILREDEDFVHRCFTTSKAERVLLRTDALLKDSYDIFVVQDLGMIPSTLLSKVFPYIRKRAKTVNIIHHNRLPKDPAFFALKWDAIVCFDERYYKFLVKAYPKERIHIIPYPCHPMKLGKKSVARRMLNLPCKEYILLLFGQKIREQMEILPVLERLSEKIPLLLLVVSANDLYCLRNYKGRLKILIREESPGIERLYTYLHAADALLYHRVPPPGVVVSSTAYQCLGSGCPMLALDSAYFYNFNGAIFVYKDLFEFEEKLLHILRKDTLYKKWQKSLKAFIKKNSAPRIAASYIRLFRSLLEC